MGRPRMDPGTRVADKQAFTVRLEAPVYLALHERARKNKRSVRAEVELIIEAALQNP